MLKKWTPGRARELLGASKYDSTARIRSRKDVGGVPEASSKLEQLFRLLSPAVLCVVTYTLNTQVPAPRDSIQEVLAIGGSHAPAPLNDA